MSKESSPYPRGSLLAEEIAQQSALWSDTVARVRSFRAGEPLDAARVIFTGAGTSAYAGSAVTEAWPASQAIPTTDLLLQTTTQIGSRNPFLHEGGCLVSLARSGDSPESAAVIERFQRHFPAVRHVAIVCNASGRIAKLPGVEAICLDPRTNDRSLAMTGSFSNLVLAGLALFGDEEITPHLGSIQQGVDRGLLELNPMLQKIAQACGDRIVVLATDLQALCREAALKIIELTAGRVMAMPETFLGFRHGAIGYLREDTPILCFLSSDPYKLLYEEDVLEDLRRKGLGRLLIIGDPDLQITGRDWSVPAFAPKLRDALRTPFEVPLAQLLAYHLSVAAGIDPDNPSPDGTITRVVRPFRIHPETL